MKKTLVGRAYFQSHKVASLFASKMPRRCMASVDPCRTAEGWQVTWAKAH